MLRYLLPALVALAPAWCWGASYNASPYYSSPYQSSPYFNRPGSSPSYDLETGMVLHLTLNETSGTSIADATGLHSPGTFAGDTLATTAGPTSLGGTAVDLNGTNQTVSFAHAADLEPTANMTFAAWIKTTSTAETFLFSKLPASGFGGGYEIGMTDAGRVRIVMRTTGTLFNWTPTTGATFNDGNWHHVVWSIRTESGTTYGKGYIDGVEVANVSGTGWSPVAAGSTPFYVGSRRAGAPWWPGGVKDMRIYRDRTLTDDEVAALYAWVPDGPPPAGGGLLNIFLRVSNQ